MKTNLKKIVRENLIKQKQINERFERISLLESKDERFRSTIQYLNELADSGYSDDELNSVVEEQFDWLKNLFGGSSSDPLYSNPADEPAMEKVKNVGLGGGLSWFKEYAIGQFLALLGFKGPLANAISTAMSEMSVRDIISVFRDKAGCMAHSRAVAGAVVEALSRYIIETSTEKDSRGANFLRNMLFSFFKEQGYDKQVGQFICNAAYQAKPKIIAGAAQKLRN